MVGNPVSPRLSQSNVSSCWGRGLEQDVQPSVCLHCRFWNISGKPTGDFLHIMHILIDPLGGVDVPFEGYDLWLIFMPPFTCALCSLVVRLSVCPDYIFMPPRACGRRHYVDGLSVRPAVCLVRPSGFPHKRLSLPSVTICSVCAMSEGNICSLVY